MKTTFVTYDPSEPELMKQIEHHWRVGITITKSDRVRDRIIREWKAGNTKILMHEEVLKCLANL